MVGEVQIKKGYKKTEVGVIPEDWDCVRMGDIGKTIIGLTYKPENIKPYGKLVLRSSNIAGHNLKFNDNVYVDVDVKIKLIVKKDDLLICVRNGSRNLIGKCALINEKASGSTFGAFMSLYRSNKTKYIFQYFQSTIIKKQMNENMGATINQITNKDLNSFVVAIPLSEKEEDLIIETLTDTDNLIQSLEKLIDKKKKIKQGTMQQLLTGKKRLPGFSGEWEVKKLGELYDISAGGDLDINNYSDFMTEKYKYPIYSNGITNKGIYGYSPYSTHIGNSVTVTARGTIGNANYREENYCAIGRLLVLKSKFLIENYMISELINECIEFTHESTGVPQLTSPQISKYDIYLPIDYNEQIAIAKILSDMDSEIKSLQQKLEKYKTIKKGMMQELLTGRIRLI